MSLKNLKNAFNSRVIRPIISGLVIPFNNSAAMQEMQKMGWICEQTQETFSTISYWRSPKGYNLSPGIIAFLSSSHPTHPDPEWKKDWKIAKDTVAKRLLGLE